MPAAADDGPWTVRHKPQKKRARWRVVAAAGTYREAVALIDGPGDWWLSSKPGPTNEEGNCDEGLSGG